MNEPIAEFPNPDAVLSHMPALVVGPAGGVILTPDGEIMDYDLADLGPAIRDKAFLICNRNMTARYLGQVPFKAFDLLELFAFIRPAELCLPLPVGLARALALPQTGHSPEQGAMIILASAGQLFRDLHDPDYAYGEGLAATAITMARAGWNWGPLILGALKNDQAPPDYAVWQHLPEWEERAPPPPPGLSPVAKENALARLYDLLGPDAEEREGQKSYAVLTAGAFDIPENEDEPFVVLAEAGTGIGKTLGYIAPASLWAEQNGGTVWLTTYTKNLQRQLDQELARLYPDPKIKNRNVVIRKGRENYLCLLNLQELSQTAIQTEGKILLGLVSRWARYSRDGDMVGGDFPAWLEEVFGSSRLVQLTDRRGECVYSACAHYRKCFIEKTRHKARYARLVIANHALVMAQSATRFGDPDLPTRYVFDEGHQLFDAADSAFSVHLGGQEGLELRRWIRGAEETGRRGKGLRRRMEDIIHDDDKARQLLEEIMTAARCLPAQGWHNRIMDNDGFGAAEKFLCLVRRQILARTSRKNSPHSLEALPDNPGDDLLEAAEILQGEFGQLVRPLKKLANILLKKLDDEAAELDSGLRGRLESVAHSLIRRADIIAGGWIPMLTSLNGEKTVDHVDWFELSRRRGREFDVGLYRHWLDPSLPFVETVINPAHGVVITSATLRDQSDSDNPHINWQTAEVRTGASHLITPPRRHSLASPFNYGVQSRVFIVNDMNRHDLDQLAAAYRELILASGGAALGIFTAISRLRQVHKRLLDPLEQNNIPLYAQHVDPINVASLIDIFREVEHSCLLGTDAVRDGIDVPGPSLRLCMFDKVPWPRPTILHKARREIFGKESYDDLLTRLRLKQAYGRLIRRQTDKGVFVMLDGATPTRLLGAFPEDVTVERLGLAEAIRKTREFLAD